MTEDKYLRFLIKASNILVRKGKIQIFTCDVEILKRYLDSNKINYTTKAAKGSTFFIHKKENGNETNL